jgi:hypothetical protein
MRSVYLVIAAFVSMLANPAFADGGFSYEYDLGYPPPDVGRAFFTPERPPSAQAFAVTVIAHGCTVPDRNPDDQLSEVRFVEDRRIAVLISAVEYAAWCGLVSPPPPAQRFTQQLPGLEAGSWTVDLYLFDPSSAFPGDLSGSEPFATGDVVVGGALPPRAIATLSPLSMAVLALALALLGLLRFRHD